MTARIPRERVDELELATGSCVEWFNSKRLHSGLDYLPPVEFETEHYRFDCRPAAAATGEPALHSTGDHSSCPRTSPPSLRCRI
jgi:hypothetical protein